MKAEQTLAYEAKVEFCYRELEKWKKYLLDKRTMEEVEAALIAITSLYVDLTSLKDKIYNLNIPEYDDPLI
jgi:hypothetical protein|tara:strand:+ start:7148 stop:7360 length:213 start_codon:yes stop_codon:yes gene_type:complete